MLALVMELIRRFHPQFSSNWLIDVQEGKIIQQGEDDCGPFPIYGARCILAGKKLKIYKEIKAFGRHLRTKYVGVLIGAKRIHPPPWLGYIAAGRIFLGCVGFRVIFYKRELDQQLCTRAKG
jgi:hypothetical protein